MLLLIILIGLIALGIFLFVKLSKKHIVLLMTINSIFIYFVIVGALYMFNGTPNGYEEPVLTSMYEILPIEKDDSWFTDEREAYVIEVSQTDPTKYFICTKRLSENIPKSFEIYDANTSLIYSDECLLKVYDVVAKPSIWAVRKIHYTQYEICVPEDSVLKITY